MTQHGKSTKKVQPINLDYLRAIAPRQIIKNRPKKSTIKIINARN
jgi:hypothetical protein